MTPQKMLAPCERPTRELTSRCATRQNLAAKAGIGKRFAGRPFGLGKSGHNGGMDASSANLFRLALAFLFIAPFIQKPLAAWDAEGHELVATMAYGRLNPKAQKAVTA